MGVYKDRNLQEDHGISGWVKGGKSSGITRHRWVSAKREIFRKTTA
jgi:hypothetical protein